MIAEIKATYDAAAAALRFAKSIQSLSKDGEVNKVVIELQQSILDLQSSIFEAQSKMEELSRAKQESEDKLRAIQKWESEKSRYVLQELAPNILVYALRPDDKIGEPSHYLCPNCFQKDEKRLLQRPSPNHTNFKCHACGLELRTDSGFSAEAVRINRRDRFSGL